MIWLYNTVTAGEGLGYNLSPITCAHMLRTKTTWGGNPFRQMAARLSVSRHGANLVTTLGALMGLLLSSSLYGMMYRPYVALEMLWG